MAGLDTRGAYDGFVQGFGLMNGYLQQQKQNERADQQMGMQMRNQEMREQEFAAQQQDRQRQQDQQQIAQFYQGWASGIEAPITPELEAVFERNKMADPRHLFNPKTEAAVSYAERLAGGEGRLFSQETVTAMNDFYAPRVGRGKGGKKRLAGIYPGQREGTLVFDLEVEDDKGFKYNAPMTVNRGTADEDDEVAQYDIEQAISPVMGAKQLYQALGTNRDKMLGYLRGAGYLPKDEGRWETFELSDGTRMQRNTKDGKEAVVHEPGGGNGRSAPAEVQTAKWLLANGVASSEEEAWSMARSAKSKSRQDFALEYARVMMSNQDPMSEATVSTDQAIQAGLQLYDRVNAEGQRRPAQQQRAQGGEGETGPLAVGKVYRNAKGEQAKVAGFDSQGKPIWEPVSSQKAQQAPAQTQPREEPPPQEQPQQPAQPADWRGRLAEQFAAAQEGSRAQQERYAEARNYRPVTAGLQMPEQPRRPWDYAGLALLPSLPR